jgi:hypothetical protein
MSADQEMALICCFFLGGIACAASTIAWCTADDRDQTPTRAWVCGSVFVFGLMFALPGLFHVYITAVFG